MLLELTNTTELRIILVSFLILGFGLPYFSRYMLRASPKLSKEEIAIRYPNYTWIVRAYFPLAVLWTLIVMSLYVIGSLALLARASVRAICFMSSGIVAAQFVEGAFAMFTGVYPLSPTGVFFPLSSNGRKYLREPLYVCEPVIRVRQVASLQILLVAGAITLAVILTLTKR